MKNLISLKLQGLNYMTIGERLQISYHDCREFSVNKEKLAILTIPDRYFYRPIAILIIPIFFNLFKLSPNKISIFSMVVVSIGFCIVSFSDQKFYALIGSLFFILFMILDCSDGSLARTLLYKHRLENPLGEFFDAFAGYYVICGLWTSLGYYLTVENNDANWFILGTLSSLASLYSRTAYLKLGWIKCEQGLDQEQSKIVRNSVTIKIYKNLDWGGFLLFAIPISIWFEFLEIVLLSMMLVNFVMLAWMFRHAWREAKRFPIRKAD
jgi:phosphatidylglycerophosphate synthase